MNKNFSLSIANHLDQQLTVELVAQVYSFNTGRYAPASCQPIACCYLFLDIEPGDTVVHSYQSRYIEIFGMRTTEGTLELDWLSAFNPEAGQADSLIHMAVNGLSALEDLEISYSD